MESVVSGLAMLRRFGQKLGPYLLLEMLLPGGTLFALLLFLYQRRKPAIERVASRTTAALTRAFATIIEPGIFVLRPCYMTRKRDNSWEPGSGR